MDKLEAFLLLMGGLGTFLLGLKLMSDNLQSLAGDRLKPLFNKLSNNRFMGIATGAGITAVIQSSSATTVMVVGFVNAGIMTLKQATGIIMGANIGTTITAHIASLQALPVASFLAATACIGAFMTMSSKDKISKAGLLICGIGIIFVGMDFMSSAMKVFSENEAIRNFIATISNPFLLMLIGLVFTALIQSSSATTSILITLGAVGMMTLRSAIFMTLGINIGTCVTAMLASIGANANAKRASVIHLLFNIFGTIIFTVLIFGLPLINEKLAFDYWLAAAFPNKIGTQIAMFHTLFNVVATIILVPFTGGLTKLATLLVREKKTTPEQTPEEKKFMYIDERILKTPPIALMMLRKELIAMANLSKTNFDLSIDCLTKLNFDKMDEFNEREKHIDFLNKKLTKYSVKISAKDISYKEEKEIASFYHAISDIERVGDYAENICEYAQELVENNLSFSQVAVEEILLMKGAIDHLYETVINAFENKNIGLKDEVEGYEDLVDTYESDLSKNHIARLHNNTCSAESGGIFLSVISNMERVADHFRNVFYSMSTYVSPSVKTKAGIKSEEGEALPLPAENANEETSAIQTTEFTKTLEEDRRIMEESIVKEPILSTAEVVENKKKSKSSGATQTNDAQKKTTSAATNRKASSSTAKKSSDSTKKPAVKTSKTSSGTKSSATAKKKSAKKTESEKPVAEVPVAEDTQKD